ncbi:formylglycine-generating enzyme family protein [Pseudomonas sp. NPDC088444]|uniref:formylglycine-generating enzyme family protein n=1 Tax=Pseudomonas sp. NPDC088444 TaxID=3364456 RepID=UPI00384E935F
MNMRLVNFNHHMVCGICLMLALQGCNEESTSHTSFSPAVPADELRGFIEKVKANLVFVEGGKFLMGDFGPEYAPEHLPYDMKKHSRPLHEVELSSYSMSKFKVTNAEFQFYLRASALQLRDDGASPKSEWDQMNSRADTPAHVDWFESENYCNWLAVVTGLPFALPTEAQWEYAARSRGQFLMVATDDGTYKAESYDLVTEEYFPRGINISSFGNVEAFAEEMGWTTGNMSPLPVAMFPPNPLGMYSMTDNGYEWVSDWYDPDYYSYSPLKDPKGPEKPMIKDAFGRYTKVLRGQGGADPWWGGGANVFRTKIDPLGSISRDGSPSLFDKTTRCVVNSPAPVVTE